MSVKNFDEGVGNSMSIKKAMLVYCLDPRFEKITRKAVEEELNCQIELIFTWPGGWPMIPEDMKKAFMEYIRVFVKIDLIILVAHEECGAYRLFRYLEGQEALNTQAGDLAYEKFMLGMRLKANVCTFTLYKNDTSSVRFLSRNYPFLDFHEVENVVMVPANNWKQSLHILRNEMNIMQYDLYVYFEEGLVSFEHQFIQEKYLFQFKEVSVKAHYAKNLLIFKNEASHFSVENMIKNKINLKIKEILLPIRQLARV